MLLVAKDTMPVLSPYRPPNHSSKTVKKRSLKYSQGYAQLRIAEVSLGRFEEVELNLLPCRPKSSDISLIENIWDVIGRRLPNLPHRSESLEGFRRQV